MEDYKAVNSDKAKTTNIILIILGIVVAIIGGIAIAALVISIKAKDEEYIENKFYEKINMNRWRYRELDNVYYQIGLIYCKEPVSITYERLSLFVPKDYLKCEQNGELYKCTVNKNGKVGTFNSETAPFIFTLDSPGYSPSPALDSYPPLGNLGVGGGYISQYTSKGIIVMHAGFRGSYQGAPLGVVDLKSAVAYIRHQKDRIPGHKGRFFSSGMSGGGAQSCLMGTTGNNKIYKEYMKGIGAMEENDEILGALCWCPITNLDWGGEAYEWNMGVARENDTERYEFSKPLAEEYAKYINEQGFKDGSLVLTLNQSDNGYYHSGTYYNYIKSIIEQSFVNFANDTEFPYYWFETLDDYINWINADVNVIKYDPTTKKATLTSLENFAKVCKYPTKSVGAFDDVNLEQPENLLMGFDFVPLHFDLTQGRIFNEEQKYLEDIKKKDFMGLNVTERLLLYTPLNFIQPTYKGFGTSTIAKYFRIRSGLFQSDSSLNTEINLALALKQINSVKDVDFESVWGKYHDTAERWGDPADNFIEWIIKCVAKE